MNHTHGVYPHECTEPTCNLIVMYDDEPKCFKHSPDSGSVVVGYSARQEAEASTVVHEEPRLRNVFAEAEE